MLKPFLSHVCISIWKELITGPLNIKQSKITSLPCIDQRVIIPWISLISSPIVGFLADKLGSYTKVLMLSVVGDAVFYTLLLFIPSVTRSTFVPATNLTVSNSQLSLSWDACTSYNNIPVLPQGSASACPLTEGHFHVSHPMVVMWMKAV